MFTLSLLIRMFVSVCVCAEDCVPLGKLVLKCWHMENQSRGTWHLQHTHTHTQTQNTFSY